MQNLISTWAAINKINNKYNKLKPSENHNVVNQKNLKTQLLKEFDYKTMKSLLNYKSHLMWCLQMYHCMNIQKIQSFQIKDL